jgi:phosphatidate cytidylyltransferase
MPRSGRRGGGRRAHAAQRRNQRSDLAARVIAAVPMALLAIVLVALGGVVFALGMLIVGAICLREFFTMFERARPPIFAGLLAFVGLMLAAGLGSATTVLLALVIAVPVIFVLGMRQPGGVGAPGITVAVFGLVWIGLPLAHVVLLRDLVHGGGVLVIVLLATFASDTGAYLGGRAFGRRPLAPAISPNKTVEGFIFGVVAGTLAAWFAGLYDDWLTGPQALLLGVTVALVAPLGDLFESFMKRQAGVKDSGTVFGAHGGALDRLDGALFAIVVGYYVWQAIL